MYFVSCEKHGRYGVTDTADGVTEFFSEQDIIKMSCKVDIDGVDGDKLTIVRPAEATVRLFQTGKIIEAIGTMTLCGDRFGIKFRSKPHVGWVANRAINISRRGIDNYSYDLGVSKTYRSSLTQSEILTVLKQFEKDIIVIVKLGGI